MQPTLARLPPLTSLRAFVATARHLSFLGAAEELHVTSAAVGQQIRLLEDYLGQSLFHRVRGQLQLTAAGMALVPGLTNAFDVVLATMTQFIASDHDLPIRVSVAPSFASKWLIPRLDGLRQAAPGLEILVDASTHLTDLNKGDTDCAIRYGSGVYPGLVVDHLFSRPSCRSAALNSPSGIGCGTARGRSKGCLSCTRMARSMIIPARIGMAGCVPKDYPCVCHRAASASVNHLSS